jgi:uncharacterized protein (DUF2141 family)
MAIKRNIRGAMRGRNGHCATACMMEKTVRITRMTRTKPIGRLLAGLALGGAVLAVPAIAQEYNQKITNDLAKCDSGKGPAVRVNVHGVNSSTGTVRVQAYRGIKSEWLETGKWLTRIEVPARTGNMSFCVPFSAAGTYAIAVRHDVNGNGKTDLTQDGGGMSNNPSINIFNLGKPSYTKTRFEVGTGVSTITIRMKYL